MPTDDDRFFSGHFYENGRSANGQLGGIKCGNENLLKDSTSRIRTTMEETMHYITIHKIGPY
jgi:hypothetical protein